ncbi:MAG: ferritin-like domain-containing protein [Myxococcales bacterium]|nr:ferritin-like domain-containing protein [Myxococcales bacterium]
MAATALTLNRTFTQTPLARQHERFMAKGVVRRPRAIPWRRFQRSRYPEPALALAAHEMSALALGEYIAVDQFSRIASALALNGVPMDLVSTAAAIPADEIRHSDYTLRFASLLTGRDVALPLHPPDYLARFRKDIDLPALDLIMVELPTIAETLAAALLKACTDHATDPVAKAVFASILSDEVHHLRLGWYYLTWRSAVWTRAERQRVADHAAGLIMGVERQFWQGRDAPPGSKQAARALGVLDTKSQRRVVKDVMQNEIVPGLDALGLGASHAWRARKRGSA